MEAKDRLMFNSTSSAFCCTLGVGLVFVNFAAEKGKKRKQKRRMALVYIGIYTAR